MKDCQGNILEPLAPEPPHDDAAVQCCFCGRLRVFKDGKGRWVKSAPIVEDKIDGWVVCPECRT